MTEDDKPSGSISYISNVRTIGPAASIADPATVPAPPPGKLNVVRTYLEMHADPGRTPKAPRIDQLALMRARNPTVAFYRFLYHTVGAPWLWYERRAMDDTTLGNIIQDPNIHIYVLYCTGTPAGFVEINTSAGDKVEIEYFGLMPEYIGQRLGPWLLDCALNKAWSFKPQRVVLQTCTLDHPKAIRVYQRAGFEPVAQEHFQIDDPRLDPALGFDPAPDPDQD